jgi:hypothetical protein
MTGPDGAGHRRQPAVTGGSMSWADAVARHLAGATCLWQDLDGLHVEPPPDQAPPTSILWAWTTDAGMVRVRLDGATAYVASCNAAAGDPVLPWAPDDGRVRAVRPAASSTAGLGLRLQQVVVDGLDTGTGPVTFLRPATVGDGS